LVLGGLYGPGGERFDPNQLLLFAEMAAGQDTAPAPAEPPATDRPRRRCRPHGRRRLPDNLPREPRHHELSEAESTCPACGHMRVDIGTDRSEALDYRPASLVGVEPFCPKYGGPSCRRRPATSQGQHGHPAQESEPMPSRDPDPQPQPALHPVRAPRSASVGPEAASLGPLPADPGQQPQAQAQPFLIPDPVEVVIAAPKPAMPIAK